MNGRRLFTESAPVIIGLVFVSASWPKLEFPYEFLSDVYGYGLVGPWAGLLVAVLLPWIEFVVGAALVLGFLRSGALVLGTGLCTLFVAVQAWALIQGLDIACGCFGSQGSIGYMTLAKTALLLLLSGAALLLSLREKQRPRQERLGD